jgi:hypothetical protein
MRVSAEPPYLSLPAPTAGSGRPGHGRGADHPARPATLTVRPFLTGRVLEP